MRQAILYASMEEISGTYFTLRYSATHPAMTAVWIVRRELGNHESKQCPVPVQV
ncbi:hypothetical protein PTE30175_03531 [Pandoraea terrae]|uniref:Uncharacterized protein n=1 Tax=Pandoraea terrae TaxID=1537710 RepID=A0A5E4X2Y4_9BURK|nr:hypothetical protein PTE30175_03531 [Pandoraea terrae]